MWGFDEQMSAPSMSQGGLASTHHSTPKPQDSSLVELPGLAPQPVIHQTSGLECWLRGRESSSPSSCPNTAQWTASHSTLLEARRETETGLGEKARVLLKRVLSDSPPQQGPQAAHTMLETRRQDWYGKPASHSSGRKRPMAPLILECRCWSDMQTGLGMNFLRGSRPRTFP